MNTDKQTDDFSKIPGPPPYPLFGWRGNLIRFLSDPLAYMQSLHRAYGDIAAFVRGRKSMIFAFGPEYNKQILSQPDLFHSIGITHLGPEQSAHRSVGHGLLSMNGPQHKRQRRLIMPAFQRNHIENYWESIVAIADDFLKSWQDGSRKDIHHEMKTLTKRISSKVFLGLDSTSKSFSVSHLMEAWLEMNVSTGTRIFPFNLPGFPYCKMLKMAEELKREIAAMIAEKRKVARQDRDVLSILIRAHDEDGTMMTDEELIGQANILFAASHETTSSALTWTLFLLAAHPAVLADLVDELENKLRGGPATMTDMNGLPLLERVLKESMRILPPAVYTYRLSSEPFELGTFRLPAKTTVAISHYITHHMAEIYPEPEKFWPDRWLTADPSLYAYLAFSAGPRTCIGAGFAVMTMKIILSLILQRYRLSVLPDAKIDRHLVVTLSPRHGMPMSIFRQDRQFGSTEVRGNIHEMVQLA